MVSFFARGVIAFLGAVCLVHVARELDLGPLDSAMFVFGVMSQALWAFLAAHATRHQP